MLHPLHLRFIRCLALVPAFLLALSCDDGTSPELPGPPAVLVLVSGDEQADTVGQELPGALVVRVEDADGDPVPGQLVNFVVTAGGGSVFAGSALTNADGEARERWTLGTSTADSQRVEVRAVDPETGDKLVFATFAAVALPDAPHALSAVGVTELFGVAGEPLGQPIAVRVADRFDNPIPGASVVWTTDAEGGQLEPSPATTDSSGIADVTWTLGSDAGSQSASASIGALEVVFDAQAAPGPVANVAIDADTVRFGALQSTRQLSATASDQFGNVVPSASLVWSATGGSAATVDQNGLVRSLANGATSIVVQSGTVADTALALVAQVVHSVALAPAGDTVLIGDSARFTPADADSNGFAIPGAPSGTWSSSDTSIAVVDASGRVTAVGRGVATIRFDAGPAAADATLRVMRLDTIAPTLVVHHPAQYTVAQPELRIAATCTDDDPDGCVSIRVIIMVNSQVRLSFTHAGGVLDTVVSLAHLEGMAATVIVYGHDPVRSTSVSRQVYVVSSDALHEEEVVSGIILDASADRLLVWDSTTAGGGALRIDDRSTGAADTIQLGAGSRPLYAYLTSRGAVWVTPGGFGGTVIESRDGTLVDRGPITPGYTLRVDGDYAIWQADQTLRRLDIVAGTVVVVSPISGNNSNDVAPNGDVVFWKTGDYNIFRYRAGTETPITADSVMWSTYPVTDGASIVYRRHDPCCQNQQYQLILWTDSGEVALTTRTPRQHSQDTHYRIENGWVAFVRFPGDNIHELWSRSPSGTEQIVAAAGGASIEIEALAGDGTIVFARSGRRYLWSPAAGGAARDVGARIGEVRLIGDVPHVFVGGSLFRIE